MIDLYTFGTPNGHKAAIMLEETGLPYTLHLVHIGKGEQKRPEYLAINPNGRIPAIVDRDGPGGSPLAVFESGAILIYLAEKSGQFLPADPVRRVETLEWLMFQMSAIGPMFGQAGFFTRATEKVPMAIERYLNESNRLLGVLNERLAVVEYLAGEDYTIADIATWPWIQVSGFLGLDLEPYPHVRRWLEVIKARPGVQRGLAVGAS